MAKRRCANLIVVVRMSRWPPYEGQAPDSAPTSVRLPDAGFPERALCPVRAAMERAAAALAAPAGDVPFLFHRVYCEAQSHSLPNVFGPPVEFCLRIPARPFHWPGG